MPQIGLLQANKNPDVYDCSSSSSSVTHEKVCNCAVGKVRVKERRLKSIYMALKPLHPKGCNHTTRSIQSHHVHRVYDTAFNDTFYTYIEVVCMFFSL